jgi:mRNA interferase RelE/StbE
LWGALRVRIVYRIIEQEVIVEVVAIGKREDLGVYQTTLKRIRSTS